MRILIFYCKKSCFDFINFCNGHGGQHHIFFVWQSQLSKCDVINVFVTIKHVECDVSLTTMMYFMQNKLFEIPMCCCCSELIYFYILKYTTTLIKSKTVLVLRRFFYFVKRASLLSLLDSWPPNWIKICLIGHSCCSRERERDLLLTDLEHW